MEIPFNKTYFTGKELEYIENVLNTGHVSGDGVYTKKVKKILTSILNVENIFMTTSCTHAIEMAVMLADIKRGDEVILPSFTFPSTANAVILRGGTPVFAEIKVKDINMDMEDVFNKITRKTKAVIPTHYGGTGCDMDALSNMLHEEDIWTIEDAAQGFFSKYKDKPLGTLGNFGCYSFHGTKNYISGEGGGLIINGSDPEMIERAHIIHQKGTNRTKFINGKVDKYSWVGEGSSYAPSDILMAVLYAQIESAEHIRINRKKIHNLYSNAFNDYINKGILLSISNEPDNWQSNYHLFYMVFDDEYKKEKFIKVMGERGISVYTHYVPLHMSEMGMKLGYREKDLPKTSHVGRTLVRLPMYTSMSEEECLYVIENAVDILERF